jgi:hypothetical protein
LFKPGYKTLRLNNWVPSGTEETTRVRRFGQDGQTIAMEPFRGTPEEWMNEMKRASQGAAAPMAREVFLQFRDPYLNLANRIWAERVKFPPRYQEPGQFFWHMQREIRILEGAER